MHSAISLLLFTFSPYLNLLRLLPHSQLIILLFMSLKNRRNERRSFSSFYCQTHKPTLALLSLLSKDGPSLCSSKANPSLCVKSHPALFIYSGICFCTSFSSFNQHHHFPIDRTIPIRLQTRYHVFSMITFLWSQLGWNSLGKNGSTDLLSPVGLLPFSPDTHAPATTFISRQSRSVTKSDVQGSLQCTRIASLAS